MSSAARAFCCSTLALSAALAPPLPAQEASTPALVSTVRRDNEWFCSISAPRAPLDGIVEQLARGMQLQLEGLELISPTTLATVELRDRPAEQALDWVLGSAGLRAAWRTGVIQIRVVVPAQPTPEELRECALATYSGALRSFPDAEAGASAAFAKATIYEHRGDIAQAIANYDSLVRGFPQSNQAAEALIRSARQLFAQGDWAGAGTHYADLLRLNVQGPFVLEARLGFANSLAHQDEFRTALRMLAATDMSDPPSARLDMHQRALIRARCVLGDGNAAAARKLLLEAQNGGLEPELEAEFYELNAHALPGDAPPEYGAVAWMEHARRATGSARAAAAAEAARLMLLSGDELGALWVDRWAQINGAGEATHVHAEAARAALGLDSQSMSTDPAEDRLARAERMMRARLWAEAHAAFFALRDSARALDGAARTRLYVGLARCLDGLERVDDALTMLREGLELVSEPEQRREFYVTAGSIFEGRGRVDDAIEAYRGRL
jgi:tetratricopeptide (TPR) repeat protein